MKTSGSLKAKLRRIESGLIPAIYRQIGGKPLNEAIQAIESSLAEIPRTPFHAVPGRDFVQNLPGLTEYLVEFHAAISPTFSPAAIYCEMNGFSINPDLWYLDAFAYRRYGGLQDPEWLSQWDSPRHPLFQLRGWEDIQDLFARHFCGSNDSVEMRFAKTVAEFVVVLRFCELVRQAHECAKVTTDALTGLPMLANAHDYDCLHESR